MKVQSEVQSIYLVVAVDKLAEQVGTGTAAVDSLVVHTAAAGTVVAGKTAAAGHTAAEAGTVDNHGAAEVAAADNRLPEVEDKCAEVGENQAGENRNALDTASGLEAVPAHTLVAVLKLNDKNHLANLL